MKKNLTKTLLKMDRVGIKSEKGSPCLTVTVGNDIGLMVMLKGDMSIGRSPDSSIVLDDDLVSSNHCSIINSNGCIFLQDNNSRNSVFVDGQRVEQCILHIGANIQVGDTIMKLELLSEADLEMRKSLYNRANHDLLTGVYNRHYFMDNARQECSLARREGRPLKMVMIDIDHFKGINDRYGHLAGDCILNGVANIIRESVRDYDLVCRYGGEEFILLLRGAISLEDTRKLCERIRRHVEVNEFGFAGELIKLTISIGACFHMDTESLTLEKVIARADKALYESKKNGRNRTTVVE